MRVVLGDYGLRPIVEGDLSQLLEWRNSARIRYKMLTRHEITWEEHKNWFNCCNTLEPPRHFVFEYRNRAIGYGGYNDYSVDEMTCSSGQYIGETKDVPIDSGVALGYMLIEYAFNIMGIKTMFGSVRSDNKRVLHYNLLLGSEMLEEENGIARLKLTRMHWASVREQVADLFETEVLFE